jgi:hypothetical protein
MAQNIFPAMGVVIALGVAAIGYFQWRTGLFGAICTEVWGPAAQ